MQGSRRDNVDPILFELGDYGKWYGVWYALSPIGYLANLSKHEVTENSDGTITVSPSILVNRGAYHGYLEQGIWREL